MSFLNSDYDDFMLRIQHQELKDGLRSINSTIKESSLSTVNSLNNIDRNLSSNLESINVAVSTLDIRVQDVCNEIVGLHSSIVAIGSELHGKLTSIEHTLKNKRATEANETTEMGRKLLEIGEIEMGLSHFHDAISIDPLNFPAHISFAEYYYKIKDYDKAIEYGKKSLQRIEGISSKNHFSFKIHFMISLSYNEINLYEKAYIHLIDGIKHLNSIDIGYVYLASKYTAHFNPQKALILIEYLIKKDNKLFSVILNDPDFDVIRTDVNNKLVEMKGEMHNINGKIIGILKEENEKFIPDILNEMGSFLNKCIPFKTELAFGKEIDFRTVMNKYEQILTKGKENIQSTYLNILNMYENASYIELIEYDFYSAIKDYFDLTINLSEQLKKLYHEEFSHIPPRPYYKGELEKIENEIIELKGKKFSSIFNKQTRELISQKNELKLKMAGELTKYDEEDKKLGKDFTWNYLLFEQCTRGVGDLYAYKKKIEQIKFQIDRCSLQIPEEKSNFLAISNDVNLML